MNCEQARIRLIDDLYGDGDGKNRDLAGHLAECEACKREAQQLRRAHQALEENANGIERQTAISAGKVIERAAFGAERTSRRWRQVGLVAVAASFLIACLMLAGLRFNWGDSGIGLAWGHETPATSAIGGASATAAEDELAAQRKEIEELKASLAAMQDSVVSQQQTSQEIIAAVQKNFTAMQMQMERSDFRISVLKANVRDLGSVLARFTAVLDSPIATNSTPGE